MLLGPVLDSQRSSGILKNMHTLHLRMKQHSRNALFLAENLRKTGMKLTYPGLKNHPQHALHKSLMNKEFGFGGMLSLDLKTHQQANRFMRKIQDAGVGYLAVSLGYFKTLFSCSRHSTSSEVPEEVQKQMGLSDGLVRFSVGLDNNMEEMLKKIKGCLQ